MPNTSQGPQKKRTNVLGRPRAFCADAALRAILEVFWQKGFAATSIDDLVAATQLSRSSLYACFGSKHALMLAAVALYADERFQDFQQIAKAQHQQPLEAAQKILAAITDADGDRRGCLLMNCIVELAPHDAALAQFSRSHIERVGRLLTELLIAGGMPDATAGGKAGAMLAIAIGIITLRKAGMAAPDLRELLAHADALLVSA